MIGSLFAITVRHGYILQILLAEAMYVLPWLRRRGDFALRAVVGLVVFAPLSIALPNVVSWYVSGLFSAIIFALTLAFWMFCVRDRFREVLFCCVGGQLTQNLAYNVENVFYQPFRESFDWFGWLALSIGCTVVVYAVCFLLFARRLRMVDDVKVEGRYVYSFAILAAVFTYAMQYLFQVYGIDRVWVSRLPLILCCVAGLCVQFGFVALKTESDERALLERVIQQEARQYETTRASMDLINLKAHDLKHQIARIKATGTAEDDEELDEISRIVDRYDSTFNTGNKELDALLAQKQLVCHESDVTLSVIAQGDALAFLRPAELASVFGNLLDNAIDYERTIAVPARRYIGLMIRRTNGMVSVRVENYCPGEPVMRDGLPVTTSGDDTRHGFGLRSVRYIVGKHRGVLNIGKEADLFVVSILFPNA